MFTEPDPSADTWEERVIASFVWEGKLTGPVRPTPIAAFSDEEFCGLGGWTLNDHETAVAINLYCTNWRIATVIADRASHVGALITDAVDWHRNSRDPPGIDAEGPRWYPVLPADFFISSTWEFLKNVVPT